MSDTRCSWVSISARTLPLEIPITLGFWHSHLRGDPKLAQQRPGWGKALTLGDGGREALLARGVLPVDHDLDRLHREGKLTDEIEEQAAMRCVVTSS